MANPDRDSALRALKNPPMLQPKASTAPTPMSRPPAAPLTSSPAGGTRTANSRLSRAPTQPPTRTPRLRSEPEYSQGTMRSERVGTPAPRSTQSPQLRSPSDAVHGRSKAKRKTLTVATRTAAPHTGHGRSNSAAYCPAKSRAVTYDLMASSARRMLGRLRATSSPSTSRMRLVGMWSGPASTCTKPLPTVTLAACSPLTVMLNPSLFGVPLAVGKRPRTNSRIRPAMVFTLSSFMDAMKASTAVKAGGLGGSTSTLGSGWLARGDDGALRAAGVPLAPRTFRDSAPWG